MSTAKTLKYIALTLAALHMGISTLGTPMGASMRTAPACIMHGHERQLCPMDVADHLASWKALFVGLLGRSLLLAAIFLVMCVQWRYLLQAKASPSLPAITPKHPPEKPPNSVLHAISTGILQPLVYE